METRNELVERHMYLVPKASYALGLPPGPDKDDCEQAAYLRLIQIADKWLKKPQGSFKIYARICVYGAMVDQLRWLTRHPSLMEEPAVAPERYPTKELLEMLSDFERNIVEHAYGVNGKEELSYQTLSEVLNCDSKHAWQITSNIIKKIREKHYEYHWLPRRPT